MKVFLNWVLQIRGWGFAVSGLGELMNVVIGEPLLNREGLEEKRNEIKCRGPFGRNADAPALSHFPKQPLNIRKS